jgi:hypothetical protein
MRQLMNILFCLLLSSTVSACIIDQLVAETNNGVNWPESAPTWGQGFVACEDGDVWEIAFWPQWNTTGLHTLILTDINCVTMWTVNNVNLAGGNQVTVDLATGSGTSRTVTSGTAYIFQLIGPAGSLLQLNLSWVDPYPSGADKTDGCASYGLDWWFRVSIDEPLSPLPIKLSSFDAKVIENGSAIELNFETEPEIGASHFEIENSFDGKTFQTIGTIEASGSDRNGQSYIFVHQKPQTNNNYYRLKQIDEDEQFEYSKIVHVYIKFHDLNHRVYPNPAQGNIDVYFDFADNMELSIQLFNLNGELLSSQQLNHKVSKISFDGNDYPPGIYLLKAVQNGQLLWVDKVIKQ